MKQNFDPTGAHVRIEAKGGTTGATPGRLAQIYINGERIPHVVDLYADFELEEAALVTMTFRPSSVEIDGISPVLVAQMLQEKCGAVIEEGATSPLERRDAVKRRRGEMVELTNSLRKLDIDSIRELREHADRVLSERGNASEQTSRDHAGARALAARPRRLVDVND